MTFGVAAKKEGEPGINGGMLKRNMPGQPFMNYVSVTSIDPMIQKVQANGGVIVLPKQEIGMGMGWIAAFKDPENNVIGLHQSPPPAPKNGGEEASGEESAGEEGRRKSEDPEAPIAPRRHDDPQRSAGEQASG